MKTARLLTSSFLLLTFLACAAAAEKSHPQSDQSSAIANIVQKAMKTDHLRAVIVKVTQGDKVVINQAFGESMTGVPATTAMHFRNGAVAFSYLGTLLMQFVDEHKIKLDDTIERWMPDLPQANKVTLKMLANQTSGLSRLRNRSEVARRLHRRSVPHLDFRRANEVCVLTPHAIRPGNELELLAHEFHDSRRDSLQDWQ